MNEITTQSESKSLQAAYEGAVYRILDGAGVVHISGDTRLDYLQRQTSNDMRRLAPTRALPNILTSPLGRVVEIFIVLDEGDAYSLLAPPGRGPLLAEYFRKRIFFNDQVTVSDASQGWAQVELHGPEAVALLKKVTSLSAAPELDGVAASLLDGKPLRAIGIRGLAADRGFRLLLPIQALNALRTVLEEEGAVALDERDAEILRVEAGLAGWGTEIKEDFTPFEVGLEAWVSADKGCYTGQEVLARQVTYDKITRQLVRLKFEQAVHPWAKLVAEGKAIGEVSSVVRSPHLGFIGLAVVRRPHHAEGGQLTGVVGDEEFVAGVMAAAGLSLGPLPV
jgi:folate-binding protein YgfZ